MNPSAARRVFIEGAALWSTRLPGWDRSRAILSGREPAPAEKSPRPAPELLPPNERRRAPDSVAIAMESALSACRHAQRDPATLTSVFTSMHGDLAITDYMCATLAADPALLSPTRFHNSVHNAAAGYWSIATGSTRPYTALSAGEHSFGAGLLESLLQAEVAGEPVLLVAYDIEARGPLATVAPSEHLLSAALVLNPRPGPRCLAPLHWDLVRDDALVVSQARPENAALVAGNAMAPCLPLLEALALGGARQVVCAVTTGLGVRLQLHAEAA